MAESEVMLPELFGERVDLMGVGHADTLLDAPERYDKRGSFKEEDHPRDDDGKFGEGGGKAKKPNKPAEKPNNKEKPIPVPDPAANRPSKPGERHEGNRPKTLPWKDPPTPQGKKGGGPAKRPKGKRSQTALGDAAEAATEALGFRNILPPGRRSNKDVAAEGSSIDVEYDHSGRAYEVKMCKTTATEYRAKPKPEEIEGKLRYAKMHDLEPYTMIGVMDEKSRTIHYYASKQPGITTKKLSAENFEFVGTAKF